MKCKKWSHRRPRKAPCVKPCPYQKMGRSFGPASVLSGQGPCNTPHKWHFRLSHHFGAIQFRRNLLSWPPLAPHIDKTPATPTSFRSTSAGLSLSASGGSHCVNLKDNYKPRSTTPGAGIAMPAGVSGNVRTCSQPRAPPQSSTSSLS